MKPQISGVIITLNEERNIGNAISSLRAWVDEVVVVDMMSDDATVEIAESCGAVVYNHPRVGFVEPARASAVARARGPWILVLDADEMVPIELSRELIRISEFDEADVCRLPRLNYILGKPMLHGLHSPQRDGQIRFFKKGSLTFSDRIHSFPAPVEGSRVRDIAYKLHGGIHHFHAANAFALIQKMNRYTDTEADQMIAASRRGGFWRLFLFPPAIFFRSYVVAAGWRDGWIGLFWAWLIAFYRTAREAKHLQLTEQLHTNFAQAPYSEDANRIASAYK